MQSWIIERLEKERRERERARLPLHIQRPPPEWIEEQERRRKEETPDGKNDRGVWIFEFRPAIKRPFGAPGPRTRTGSAEALPTHRGRPLGPERGPTRSWLRAPASP